MADPSGPPEALPDRWFCTLCQVGDVTSSDVDRCCLMCGVDLVSLTDLRSLLSRHGLHIVTAEERQRMVQNQLAAVVTKAERAVLEACGNLSGDWLQKQVRVRSGLAAWAQAELARREKA